MTIFRKAGLQQTPWIAFIFACLPQPKLKDSASFFAPLLGPILLHAARGRLVMLKTGRLPCSGSSVRVGASGM